LYVQVFRTPAGGGLDVAGIQSAPERVELLAPGGARKLEARHEGDLLRVAGVPQVAEDELPVVLRVTFAGVPELNPMPEIPVRPDPEGTLVLEPRAAKLSGPKLRVEGGEVKNLGWWADPTATASWTFPLSAPGRYRVMVNQACPANGRPYRITAGEAVLEARTTSTKGWGTYIEVEAGVLDLPSGPVTLRIRPGQDGAWSGINLRSVKLIPDGSTP
jgi:hypothetical protein